jgi:L-ascorbate metabolism protein UlaG (beta-lactamase superfamily)
MNILTDPIYSQRASPVSFVGPRRVRPPGIRFENLPPIHAAEAHQPRIVVGLGNRALLEEAGIASGEELDWWQSAELAPGDGVGRAGRGEVPPPAAAPA